ncbi:P-loop containing nucleoside triphosphate hydrolase protein [Mycena amicta]|nr:P-loop containing nucleoside triphosphate hydrolase protein [Mycena amicta]
MAVTNLQFTNRRGRTRTVPLEVISLGFSRTGTVSMRAALEKLGYNEVNHGFKVSANPYDRAMWDEALDAKFLGKGQPFGKNEWDELLGHCMAVADMPHLLFADELIAAYPDAKIILTIRDPDKWWNSFQETVFHRLLQDRPPSGVVERIQNLFEPQASRRMKDFWRRAFTILFRTPNPTPEEAKNAFLAHYEHVRSLVPVESGRLLEYRVGEGWDRLCVFLGKEVPKEEFPRLNDRGAYHEHVDKRFRSIRRKAVEPYVAAVAMVTLAVGFFWMLEVVNVA